MIGPLAVVGAVAALRGVANWVRGGFAPDHPIGRFIGACQWFAEWCESRGVS